MKTVNKTAFRNNFKTYLNQVNAKSETFVITKKGYGEIVVMPFDEYSKMREKQKLLNNFEYYKELEESVNQFKETYPIIDED
ncbi:hypothetical protein MmiHf6_00030 [Methanimicrococcus hongohii]|uniref:Antitoxin n=1 Tax=Methanimicrococcus hongohii TaxID=3028295 RepID=A0AA97A0W8_9EURY|nr:type II toxin-antitoxin system Phd/YefM family antitoxin [Methanimicrococcus sp. Hf6]WNY22718.1 hypothetical protein MmiHf6_00030 [Methanimicrococcus sp. Hf6]